MSKNATKSKFKSESGSKWKYQTRNTLKLRDHDPSTNYMHFLLELVVPTSCIVDYIDNKIKFDKTMVKTDHLKYIFRGYFFGDFFKVFILEFT